MRTLSLPGNTRTVGRSHFLVPVKLICLLISAYSLDTVAYSFKSAAAARAVAIREHLYFTNISLLYTVFAVMVGFLTRFNKPIHSVHTFSVATALILEFIVTLTFWPLFIVDPMLIKNKSDLVGAGGPSIIGELPKHALPAVILLIEQAELQIRKQWSHRFFFVGVSILYYLVSELYTARVGLHLYPFLKKLSAPYRFIFFIGISLVALCMYEVFFGFRVHWRTRTRIRKRIVRRRRT